MTTGNSPKTRATLTAEQVREIRREYQPGRVGYARLAKKYGVTKATIRDVILGVTWRHAQGPRWGDVK